MKKPKIVKFSISMRQEVQQMLDQLAFQEGRTRSNLIEYLCKRGLQKKEPTREV